MTSAEKTPGSAHTPDLSLLKEMVGVQKALKALAKRKLPMDRDVVLAILEAQQEIYASEGLFKRKALAIAEIATGLQQGTISVKAVLQAAGIGATETQPGQSGLRGLLTRLRSR